MFYHWILVLSVPFYVSYIFINILSDLCPVVKVGLLKCTTTIVLLPVCFSISTSNIFISFSLHLVYQFGKCRDHLICWSLNQYLMTSLFLIIVFSLNVIMSKVSIVTPAFLFLPLPCIIVSILSLWTCVYLVNSSVFQQSWVLFPDSFSHSITFYEWLQTWIFKEFLYIKYHIIAILFMGFGCFCS